MHFKTFASCVAVAAASAAVGTPAFAESNDQKQREEIVKIGEAPSFKGLRFDASERLVLQKISDDQEYFKCLIVLFAATDWVAVPKTPGELVEALGGRMVDVDPPHWTSAVRGLRQIRAAKVGEELQWFLLGSHPTVPGRKPQTANRPFFKNLADAFLKSAP